MTRASRRAGEPPRTRRGGRSHARRPRPPLRKRIRRWLPGRARAVALLMVMLLGGGLVYLVNGPLLHVEEVAWDGTRFSAREEIDARLAGLAGTQLLALDTAALEASIEELPGIAGVRIDAQLPRSVTVTIDEDEPAMLWLTDSARLAVAADGGVVGEFASTEELPRDLAELPRIDDRRRAARDVGMGDRIDAVEAQAALRLATLDPALLGSQTPSLAVRVEDLYGFTLEAPDGWEAVLGFYGREPGDDADAAASRIERQVAAVRTLFAGRPEASVIWLDARNPGKIYFRATEG